MGWPDSDSAEKINGGLAETMWTAEILPVFRPQAPYVVFFPMRSSEQCWGALPAVWHCRDLEVSNTASHERKEQRRHVNGLEVIIVEPKQVPARQTEV